MAIETVKLPKGRKGPVQIRGKKYRSLNAAGHALFPDKTKQNSANWLRTFISNKISVKFLETTPKPHRDNKGRFISKKPKMKAEKVEAKVEVEEKKVEEKKVDQVDKAEEAE